MDTIYFSGQVYLSDTDTLGIAHHSRYLVWFENARSHYLASTGHTIEQLKSRDIAFPVYKISVSHFQPLKEGDNFHVGISDVIIKGSYIRFQSQICSSESEIPVTTSNITLACIKLSSGALHEIPDDLQLTRSYA